MFEEWTRQRVLGLAPDTASAKAGSGLSKSSKWSMLGHNTSAVWGEIKGSGSCPYQVRIDLTEPAFKCSCPSRKFPCKHALGLLLVLAEEASAIQPGEPPEWVADWLAKRSQQTEQREQRAKSNADKPVDPKAQARRAAKRDERIRAGIEEAAMWLADVMRAGLAVAQTQPGNYWQHPAARLVDAQAPGLARYIRQMRDSVAAGDCWQERFLDAAGRLFLTIEAYRRLDELPEDVRADVRSAIGLTVSTDELIATQPAVSGRWLVLGQQVEQEEHLQVRRTWLVENSDVNRVALILDFAAGAQTLDTSLIAGMSFQGELVYYPGRNPLRAVIKARDKAELIEDFPSHELDAALALYGRTVSTSPWIDRWPMLVGGVCFQARFGGNAVAWSLRDGTGRCLPISASFVAGWTALSVTGARPCSVFGEWDGRKLLPLAIRSDQGMFIAGRRAGAAHWGRASA